MTSPVFRSVDPKTLKPAPWNPDRRTRKRNLRDLVKSMREDGFWDWEPIQLARDENTGEWVVADGNRRLAAALEVGLEEVVTVKIYAQTAQEYWAKKNGTIRAPTVREAGEAIAKGLKYIPPSHERSISNLLDVYTGQGMSNAEAWKTIQKLFQEDATPSIVNIAQRIANACDMQGDYEFMARTIEWLKNHKMSLTVSRAFADGIPPSVIFDKISSDEPLRTGYS